MEAYQKRLGHLLAASEDLKGYLAGLPTPAWSRPSACDQWQIADVVAHLVMVAESYTSNVSRGLRGESHAPPGRVPAGSDTGASAAERIARGAIDTRRRLGDQLLATFEATDGELNRLLAALSPRDQERPCYHSGGTLPAGNFVDLRLNELTIHHWDIRSGLEHDARLSPRGLPSTMLMFTQSLAAGAVRWAFWPEAGSTGSVRYRFDVTGPVPMRADILVDGDRARLEEPGPVPADVDFRCDAETFVLLMYGRLATLEATHRGRLEARGDPDTVARFSRWFRGI